MADDDINESFLYLLEKDFDESEATGSNQNFKSVDVWHSNADTPGLGIQLNRWLNSYRSVSTSSLSRETRVVPHSATPFSFPGYGNSFGVLTSDALVGSVQSIPEALEKDFLNSSYVPFEATRGDFSQRDEVQSIISEISSKQHNVGWSNWRPTPQKRLGSTSFGVVESTCRMKKRKRAEFHPHWKPSRSVAASPPELLTEGDRNEGMEQTKEDYRELSRTSAMFSQIEDASNKESLVSVAGPSGFQAHSHKTEAEKPFACDVCGKAFKRIHHLGAHYRTHTGDKPFVCDKCGKAFARQSNLTMHLRTHTGEKPFTCEVCGKGFSRKDVLEIHLRTHSGEKPYSCKWCRRQYSDPSNFRKHLKHVHGQE